MTGPYLAIIRYLLQRPALVACFTESEPRHPSREARALDALLTFLRQPGNDGLPTEAIAEQLKASEFGAIFHRTCRLIRDIGDTGEDELAMMDAISQYVDFEWRFQRRQQLSPGVGFSEPTIAPREVRPPFATTDAFLLSFEWRQVRMMVLKRDGARCACCGASPATGAVMNVDHIKPRKTHPELALDPANCQVLCNQCNHGKGNWDATDWRNP